VQLQKALAAKDTAQAEYDALKDHLEGYMSASAPIIKAKPTRHISHLTQMAARALNRTAPVRKPRREDKEAVGWDEIGHYDAKGTWSEVGMADDVVRPVQDTWVSSWARDT
jgi:dynactin-4